MRHSFPRGHQGQRCTPPDTGVATDYEALVSAMALSGWWRGSFTASPWTGTASGGASGGRNLSEATNPPATGASQGGLTSANFDGTNDRLATGIAASNFWDTTVMSAAILYRSETSAAPQPAGTPYLDPGIIGLAGTGFYGIGHNNVGPRIFGNDGTYDVLQLTATTGSYHLVQMKKTGGSLFGRVDGGSWSSVATGATGALAQVIRLGVGATAAASAFFDGDILDTMLSLVALSDADFNTILAYVNQRYGLSL